MTGKAPERADLSREGWMGISRENKMLGLLQCSGVWYGTSEQAMLARERILGKGQLL